MIGYFDGIGRILAVALENGVFLYGTEEDTRHPFETRDLTIVELRTVITFGVHNFNDLTTTLIG